ncbi:hypothetical protein F5Y14DRAFT_412444 [Nemania sp. NC0429]|nr:hypothetical protein F5Y14DRAFT_412444 [Nemania sp. NC0429]
MLALVIGSLAQLDALALVNLLMQYHPHRAKRTYFLRATVFNRISRLGPTVMTLPRHSNADRISAAAVSSY